ncbi:MAG TPA: hypothetical protein VIM44_07275 [Rariglobus sp.]
MKSLTLALCVIAILGSAASTFFYFQVGNSKELLKQDVVKAQARATELQSKLDDSTSQAEVLQKRLAELDSDLGEAKSKVTAADSRSTQLTRDIAQLRNQLTAKADAEQALNGEIAQLKREIAQAKLGASGATAEEVDAYKASIAALQAKVTELEAGRGVKAGTVDGTGTTAAPSVAGLKGEVVSIGAQNAFVVINAGSAAGVQPGQKFAITRNGAAVADAQVSSVQEGFSIAQIVAGSIHGGLVKGDLATSVQ